MEETTLTQTDKTIVIHCLNQELKRVSQNLKYTKTKPSQGICQLLRRLQVLIMILEGRADQISQRVPEGSTEDLPVW